MPPSYGCDSQITERRIAEVPFEPTPREREPQDPEDRIDGSNSHSGTEHHHPNLIGSGSRISRSHGTAWRERLRQYLIPRSGMARRGVQSSSHSSEARGGYQVSSLVGGWPMDVISSGVASASLTSSTFERSSSVSSVDSVDSVPRMAGYASSMHPQIVPAVGHRSSSTCVAGLRR